MGLTKKLLRVLIPRSVRNWLRSPSKSFHWAWDEFRYAIGANQTLQIRPGWSLVCHPASYRAAYQAQDSDPEQVAEFDSFIRNSSPGMLLFDIGAHFGLFSLAALHYGGPSARSIAVDPSPMATRFTKLQAGLNRVSDRLHVIQASAGDQSGWQDMVSVGVLASGYYVAPSKEHAGAELTRSRVLTLDQLAQEFDVVPTHIKIDVEGYEAAVLRGGKNLLNHTSAPLLFVELHNQIVRDAGGDPADTLALLRAYGYRAFTSDCKPIDQASLLAQPLVRIIASKSDPGI
jgi:FkbM family methyltransferase